MMMIIDDDGLLLDQKSRVLSDNFEESFIVGQEKVMNHPWIH